MQKLLLALLITLSLPLFASLPAVAGAQTLSDLESRIAALLSQIQTLQSELQTLKTQTPTETPEAPLSSSSFTTTLGKGSEGRDVTRLQQYLAKDPTLYPEGLITGYFGSLTEAAVKRFQTKHNIVSSGTPLTTGYGHVGPATRAKLNSLLVTTSSSTTPLEPSGSQANPASNGAGPLNRSPNLSITGERSLTLPNKATLTALATDDGLPTNSLTYFWSKASGPGTATFSSLTTKDTTITFSAAGTYQITATVSDGDLFASYTIALTALPPSTTATTTPPVTTLPAPTLSFSASQTSLTKGSSTTLSWSSTNALSCSATGGWLGSKTSSGSTTLTPTTTTTYTLTCKGGGGDAVAKSVTVTVTNPAPQPEPEPTAGADLNGYVAEYECRKGNPNCDVDVEGLAKQSCDVVVYSSDSDWSKIEDHPEHTTYCIAAGDHTDKNVLYLPFSGTANNRKVLRYYSASDSGKHPVAQSSSERANLYAVQFKNSASYWLIHRLTFDGDGANVNTTIRFRWNNNTGSNFNILSKLLLQNAQSHFVGMGTGNADNTLQNSVVRKSIPNPLYEAQCVEIGGGPRFHVVNNEIYNCQKAVSNGNGLQNHPGFVIENNDLYVTPEFYTDCNGNYTPTGSCSGSEQNLNIKAGGTQASPSIIIHNRLWGARKGDSNLGLSLNGDGSNLGFGGHGDPTASQATNYPGGDWVLVLGNISFDAAQGFKTTYNTPDHASLIGNIFWDLRYEYGYQRDPGAPAIFNLYGGLRDSDIYFNTLISGEEWLQGSPNNTDMQCNIVMNAKRKIGTPSGGSQISNNAFYNTPEYSTESPSGDLAYNSASDSKNTEYCFYRKLLTNQERVCIPYAKTTTASPHYSQCSQGAGQRSGIGINDKIWTWADTLFNF